MLHISDAGVAESVRSPLRDGLDFVEGVPAERYSEWLDCWLAMLAPPPGGAFPDVVRDFYQRYCPPGRAIAVEDDGGYVATAASFNCELVMPGGAVVPVAACTAGSCHPTLTRRGLMSTMLDRLYRRAAEEGMAASVGTPSEWPIYQRFGEGPATWCESVVIDVARAGLRDDVPGAGIRPHRVAGAAAREAARNVFARQAATTPGEVIMPAAFWDRLATEPSSPALEMALWFSGPDGGARQCAAIEDRGFVSYRITSVWTEEHAPNNVLEVIDFLAADGAAAGALWRYLFSIDMIGEIRVGRLPVDDPLRWWVHDARWLRSHRVDGLWLRPIDVPRLLAARAWSVDGALTLRVHDARGYADGTYRLASHHGAGTCQRTTDEPDLELDVSILGSILLGGTQAATMHRSGRLLARDPRQVRRWDAMATPERAPFLSYWL